MPGAAGIAGIVAGLVIAAAGFYMLRWGRTKRWAEGDGEDPTLAGPLAGMLGSLSLSSRYLIGFCLVVLGYHFVAYSLPSGLLWLRVPSDMLWVMAVAMVVGVGGSLTVDALERR